MMKKTEILLLAVLVIASFSLGFIVNDYAFPATERIVLQELPQKTYSAQIDIVAVRMQGEIGIVNTATVEITEGKGRVLFALNPFVEPDTQQSAETAKLVAEEYTKKSLGDKDVIYSIDAGNVQLVGGPSAGAALTAATIAAIEETPLRTDVSMTGTILEDGSIGQIGGVLEKFAAVAEQGKTLFLVPKGQSMLQYYEPRIVREERGPFILERTQYIPKTLDLNEYAKEQGWTTEIKEVRNISEAMEYLF